MNSIIVKCPCIKIEYEFRVLAFVGGGKLENLEKNEETPLYPLAGSGFKPRPF